MSDVMFAALFKLALLTAATQMKVKKPKRIKTAKPQRVVNPGEAHTVRIYPRQGLRVVVDSPKMSKYTSENAKWRFTTLSPYLIPTTETNNRKEQEVYEFAQVYDLSDWATQSEVFLGEIQYELVDNFHPDASKAPAGGSMMIYAIPETKARPDVLTVVNPDSHVVKLEPHRTLEVVIFEDWPKGHLDEWVVQIDDVEVQNEGIFLKEITRTYITDTYEGGIHGGQNVLPRHTPTVNPNLPNDVRDEITTNQYSRSAPTREHHIWFAFSQESQKRAARLKSGNSVVAKLTFTGRCMGLPAKVVKREMIVILSLHGKRAKISGEQVNDWESLPPAEVLAKALAREKTNTVLTNPGPVEQIDLNSSNHNYVIEIVSPLNIWPDEPETGRWEIEHDNPTLKDRHLGVESIMPILKYGKTYQRFSLYRKGGEEVSLDQKILGAFKIFYPSKKHTEDGVRRVSVWLVKDSESARSTYRLAPSTSNRSCSIYTAPAGLTQSVSYAGQHWKNGQGYYTGRPERSKVTFEEIPLAPLEENAKTRRLCDVNPNFRQSVYYDYEYDDYEVRSAPTKKKSDTSPNPPRNPSGAYTAREIGTTSQGSLTPTTTAPGNEEDFILYNPVNLQEITLQPGQEVVIRLAQPEDVFQSQGAKDRVKGDLWGVLPLQVGEVKPTVVYSRVQRLTTEKYRQEIRLKINPDYLPSGPGTHIAGAVQLQSLPGNRIIRFYVKKGESDDRPVPAPIVASRVVSNLIAHEAAGRKYEFLPTWKNEESVVLDPTTTFYVKNPLPTSQWPGEWSIRLVPTPITIDLWNKLKTTKGVNRMSPWMKRDQPVHLNGSLYFKPLTLTFNDDIDAILKELAAITGRSNFPVATLVYENFNNKKGAPTDEGTEEVLTKIRKKLYIFVKLPQGSTEKVKTFDVDQGCTINVGVNQEFVVRVRPFEPNSTTKMRWTMGNYPAWIDYHGVTQSDYDVFRMRAMKPGDETMVLRCGTQSMSFRVAAI